MGPPLIGCRSSCQAQFPQIVVEEVWQSSATWVIMCRYGARTLVYHAARDGGLLCPLQHVSTERNSFQAFGGQWAEDLHSETRVIEGGHHGPLFVVLRPYGSCGLRG
jgi:hypothetical protein